VTRTWIRRVALAVPEGRLDSVARFYLDGLGLAGRRRGASLVLAVGDAELRFDAVPGGSEPFSHFALLVPGNRFEAAREWLGAHAPLLARPDTDETDFEFAAWNACACYAHDPAGNILELIAHHGFDESAETGEFAPAELRAISEIGIVDPDPPAAVERLRTVGLELWSGEATVRPTTLAFVGSRAHTLILSPPGRPWFPTGRPAETHPVEVAIETDGHGEVVIRAHPGRPLEVAGI
jgi:hypothetical protein